MIHSRRALPILALAVALLIPSIAFATIAPPVHVRWVGDAPKAARAGEEIAGAFEIRTGAPGLIGNLRLEGEGWTVRALDAPGRIVMARGATRVFGFRALAADPKAPLVVRCTFDGREVQKTFRFDAATIEKARGPGRAEFANGKPIVDRTAPQRPQDDVIRFRGRVTYFRSDNVEFGADSMFVKIMDDDSPDPFDEVIWQGYTDTQGFFDVTVSWDDCDALGCDDPDVYLVFETINPAIDVEEPDLGQTTYSWSTQDNVIDDYTGNDLILGIVRPNDPADFGAVHVYNSMRRAWRHAHERGGMAAGRVEVTWPSSDGTNYNEGRIQIEPGETWNEGTQSHEFGHHLHESFGDLSHYDGGNDAYCGEGHCIWCPESEANAFAEGFAGWFGYTVINQYAARYGITPLSIADFRYTLEQPQNCQQPPNGFFPDSLTEGFTGALLRDMEDAGNDDHDGGAPDCDMDAMTIGDDEIYTVFRDDDPWTIRQFINAFRNRYTELDQDFWSTTRNAALNFGFPITPPIVTSQPEDCRIARAGETVVLQVQGNGALLVYQWRKDGENVVDGGGITGAQTKTLTLSPASASMSGTYNCFVTTCNGTYTTVSLPSRITIQSAPNPRSLVSWGENGTGQVGNGTISFNEPPMVHPNLPDMVAADGGRGFTVALRADGSVYSWGQGQRGELGLDFGVTQQNSPGAITGVSGILQLASGANHTLALDREGAVWGWGYNGFGQLGDSSGVDRWVPRRSLAVHGCVKQVACGDFHSLVLLADGTVLAWGDNDFGALGRGNSGGWSLQPQPVTGLSDVIAISACGYLNLALKADGTVWSWGWNSAGALGNGSMAPSSSLPVQVANLPVIRKITAGYANGYAISNTGATYAWGAAGQGMIGDGNTSVTERRTPVIIPSGLTLPVQIVSGQAPFVAALQSDGTVRVWGYNYNHVLGGPSPTDIVWTPTAVANVNGAQSLGAGWSTLHACGQLTGVTGAEDADAPLALTLRASPNPSFAATQIAFDLPRAGRVSLAVYDVTGRLVRSLVEGERAAGRHAEPWDGRGESGGPTLAGVYFVRMQLDGEARTERVVRMR